MDAERPASFEETGSYIAFDAIAGRFFETARSDLLTGTFGALTHAGRVREVNEDHHLIVRRRRERDVLRTSLPRELLPDEVQQAYSLAVADGLGGRRFGELASFLALRTGWDLGGGEIKWSVKMNERERTEFEDKARVFFQVLNRTFREVSEEEPLASGMATTLTICYTTGVDMFLVHCGDSRAYLYRDEQLTPLTRDHTVAQRMLDHGEITAGSPEERRSRHILTSGLGSAFAKLDVDVLHRPIIDGDRLLLCTDGLTNMVPDERIAAILAHHLDPDETCRLLVDEALAAGGKDNVTVIIGDFKLRPTPPPY